MAAIHLSSLAILLGCLAVATIVILIADRYNKEIIRETFANMPSLTFCPMQTKPYSDPKTGDTQCCDGAVSGNVCSTKPVCTLGSKSNLAPCTQVLTDYYKLKAKDMCPAAMPNYYENTQGTPIGCTASALDASMTRPQQPSQPSCTIYAKQSDNQKNANSCMNQRMLDQTACFGQGCSKSITIQPSVGLGIVTVDFGDKDGHRHTCYDPTSYMAYLNMAKPDWKASFDVTKSIKMCPVAKAVFIDRTMVMKDTTQ